jgi:hypothetical protein
MEELIRHEEATEEFIWWYAVKYDRKNFAYLVVDREGVVVDAYEHDPSNFDDRRRAYREALEDAKIRDWADLDKIVVDM